ncbi:ANM_HP_G0108060.mRNA.1.CDS.1 [Saccharomyces cerevisiae]|nr:ANM_HP_G0108060.mRNA.1.CDS.1 [Saccharomyces cerevisiae]CAI6448604.1 ANM_HP_G0108060.mRNA.1.CDS.1 [Saccharomyces cerevisiae]
MDRKKDPSNNLTERRVSKVQRPNKKKVRNQVESLSRNLERNKEGSQLQPKCHLEAVLGSGHSLGREKENGELGIRSIFYDKDWNPRGTAPSHYRNIPYNPATFKRRTEVQARLGNLENIKIPK